jgi:hypothetical protein
MSKLERLKRLAFRAKDAVVSTIYGEFGVALMRARREEDTAIGYQGVAACIIAGVILAIAKPLAKWITGIDPDNPGGDMPVEVGQMFGKLLTLITYIGVVLMVLGLVWAGINLARRRENQN